MTPNITAAPASVSRKRFLHFAKKAAKRTIPPALALYFIPITFAVYVGLGLLDFVRNSRRTLNSLDRYFAGNGIITWLLCPFNLLMDVLTLPYWNKGVYQLADLPSSYQNEIKDVIESAKQSDLVGKLSAKMEGTKRGMIFFKWYGKNVETSVDVPEFHKTYKFIRTIGVSIFNTRQSTGKHFGPLRVTLRVLYNVNDIKSQDAFIRVGNVTNYWRDQKLFIFDDTLQHQSCNQSDEVRYCMFIDILRPSLVPWLFSGILACVRMLVSRLNFAFYKHWAFIK